MDRKAYQQQWEIDNAVRRRAYFAKRYRDNYELRKQQQHDYYERNKPRFREAHARYRERNRLALKIKDHYGVSVPVARLMIAGQVPFGV